MTHPEQVFGDKYSARVCRVNSRLRSIVLVVLAVLSFSAGAFKLSAARTYPRYDQVAYLAAARDFAREGGVIATVRCYVEARCRENNRQALYMFLMEPFMDDSPASFARAKLLTHATAFFLMLVVFFLVRRMFSNAVAIGSVVALCSMPELQDLGSRVLHDPLYAALTFLAVHAIASWQERGFFWWLAAGGLVGLAFLTKGSGHLLFFPLIATSLYRHRSALVCRPVVYGAVVGFVTVAFFLLWRNLKLWGSPFYNINAPEVWIDRWQDVWALQRSPVWNDVGLGWYLHRHSLFDLLIVLGKGVGITAGVFLYVAGIGLANPVARAVTGVVLWTLAGLGLHRRWRADRRVEVVATLSTLGVYFAALSLAQGGGLGGNARYALPYVTLVLPYAIYEFLMRIWPPMRDWWVSRVPGVSPSLAGLSVLAAMLLLRLATSTSAAAASPLSHYAVEPRWHETSEWFARSLAPGERFAIPFQSYYSTWDAPRPDTDPRWSFWFGMPPQEFLRFLETWHVRKVLVDREGSEYAEYADKLSAAIDAHGPLTFLGWPRCFADGATPSRFLVYCQP
jgi:Dolichyl-phosphate-mannose-protein mannosyltransferase